MILVEKHIINKKHPFYSECDELAFKSKNLYNAGLYNVRQHYFENKNYLSYVENYHLSKSSDAYKSLPAKVSNQTLKLVDQNFKSFFGLMKVEGFSARIPKYLDKVDGRYLVKYEKQAINIKNFKKNGKILLSKTNIEISTRIKDFDCIKEVRIIKRNNHYVIEVVYEKQENVNNNIVIASIDHGLNNLATVCYSNGITPQIINGKPLKSINQYYNKKRSFLKSELEIKQKKKKSKKLASLYYNRNNKINDYLHKASRLLVNQLVSNKVKTLVIGKNNKQKQDSKMSKANNQNFIGIPTFRFLNMIAYKANLEGIDIIWQEESYTSKSSFLNLDEIPVYVSGDDKKYEFSGYRKHRGLYKIKKSNLSINSDVNGSYNIMRKAIPNVITDGIEGFAVNPIKLNI